MAKPQLEDGHTRIANAILEHLMMIHLSANQWQVLLCIIRKTYGYQKKVDHIANSQICEATGLCKAVVSRVLHSLGDLNLVIRTDKLIGLQKDWDTWKGLAVPSTLGTELAKQSTPESLQNGQPELAISSLELAIQSTIVSSAVPENSPIKEKRNYTKETIQKKEYGEFLNVKLASNEYQKLVDRFGESETNNWIGSLSEWLRSTGKVKKDHYATILNWSRRNGKGGQDDNRAIPKAYKSVEEHRKRLSSK